jgi:hypothetical protein
VLAVCLLLGGARPLAAQEGPRWEGPSAFGRAARSVVFPAWGQLTNGKTKKAAILFSVETYIYTRIVMETRRGKEDERRAAALEEMGAPENAIASARASADEHFNRRRDLFFWAIVAAFYGAIDAYIDAHLGDFEKELEDGRTLFGDIDVGSTEQSVELGIRF